MDLTRRDALKVVGLAAAATGLSCASSPVVSADSEKEEGVEEMAEMTPRNKVLIKRCGQYVVVEVDTPGPTAFRGRLEVAPGDTVEFHNHAGGDVRLEFPPGVTWDRESGEARDAVVVEGIRGTELTLDKPIATIAISKTAPEGRYEYTVLYDTTILAVAGQRPPIVSRWAHAIGGSSSEFIIRRDISP